MRGRWTLAVAAVRGMPLGWAVALASMPFLAVSVVLGAAASRSVLEGLASTTVGVAIAVAVFAVNFSFVVFQLAPYRALLAGPSRGHVGAASALILFALVPLTGAACGSAVVGRLGVIAIPLLAYGAVLLVALGLREAGPPRILSRRASDRALATFTPAFARAVRAQTRELDRLEVDADGETRDDRVPPPMHEITHRVPPPPIDGDPLDACVDMAAAAVERDDAAAFVPAVERLLPLGRSLVLTAFPDEEGIEEWRVRGAAELHARASLARLVRTVTLPEGREVLADRFIEVLARYVRLQGTASKTADTWTLDIASSAAAACRSQLDRKTAGAGIIGFLLAARQVTEQALRARPDGTDEFSLAAYATYVQSIGEAAVGVRNSDIVFRCLETLSWIGCSAVRYHGSETGRRAAHGLVQLGRLARAADLECHWERCALTPYEHADERLKWMATWIPKAERAESWLSSIGTAFARLRGYRCELRLESGQPPRITLVEDQDTPHRESFTAEGGHRTLDYSDPSMLKDWALH
jgi:hypothetical protein